MPLPGNGDSTSLRLLLVVPFSPRLDIRHGGRVVAQLLMRLTQRHRVGVIYLRHPGSSPIDDELAARCDVVREVRAGSGGGRSRWRHRFDVLAGLVSGVPSAVAPLHDRRLARACAELAESWGAEVVQVEHDHLAYCGRALQESDSSAARVLVCHEPGLSASQDQARATSGRQRFAHRLDVGAWRRYWARALPAFDAIVTFTDQDRREVEGAVPGPRFETIELGIDLPPVPLSAPGAAPASVLFVGGYLHPPNVDAALRLVRAIMPAVRKQIPGLQLFLVGADPSREMRAAATDDDVVTGPVPSVAPFLDRASLLVLPITLGGGMRVKLLEGLASGKAVVASPVAAAGLGVTSGRELVLAETDQEFVDAIVALVRDPAMRSRLGRQAREWAVRNLTWESRVPEYEALYRTLVASRTS